MRDDACSWRAPYRLRAIRAVNPPCDVRRGPHVPQAAAFGAWGVGRGVRLDRLSPRRYFLAQRFDGVGYVVGDGGHLARSASMASAAS